MYKSVQLTGGASRRRARKQLKSENIDDGEEESVPHFLTFVKQKAPES